MSKIKNDPENYHKMSEPHESIKDANDALDRFFEKVSEARKECKIADVLIVTKDSIRAENGEVGQFMQHSQLGSALAGVAMSAYAYGKLQAEQKEMLSKLVAEQE